MNYFPDRKIRHLPLKIRNSLMELTIQAAMLVSGGNPARERPTGSAGIRLLHLWKDLPLFQFKR
jgi:hypothetical protein